MRETRSKYEIRSSEVQEVMNKPPHFVVNWGNTIILISIIMALYVINMIEINNKEQVLGTLVSQKFHNGHNQYIVQLNTNPNKEIHTEQQLLINVTGDNALTLGTTPGTLDSVWKDNGLTFLAIQAVKVDEGLKSGDNQGVQLSKGMFLNIHILTGKERILSAMLKKMIKR